MPASEFRLDRKHFSVARITDADDSLSYWLTEPPPERLRAVELIRQTFYDYSESGARLQRVLEIAKLDRS